MEIPQQSFLQRLSPRELMLLVITVLVVIVMAYYKFEYEALGKRKQWIEQKSQQVAQNISSFQAALGVIDPKQLVDSIKTLEQRNAQLRRKIESTRERMTEKVADIVKALSRQAKFQKAEMLRLNSREKLIGPEGERIKEVTLFLTIKSNYAAVTDFVESLEQIPAVLSIRELEISRNREIYPRVETRFTIKLYVL